MFHRLVLVLCVCFALLQSGCAVNRSSSTVDPGTNWQTIKSIHVVKQPKDTHDIHLLIAEKLKANGFSVTVDPEPKAGAQALVTYTDKWMWDLTMYLLELTVVVRDSNNDFPLASGNSYHTSLTRKSPKEMVDEVMNNILKDRK